MQTKPERCVIAVHWCEEMRHHTKQNMINSHLNVDLVHFGLYNIGYRFVCIKSAIDY